MAKSQIVELKDGKIIVSTYKNGVFLASAAPDIEVLADGTVVMGCTRTSREAWAAMAAAVGNGAPGRIQAGYIVADNRTHVSAEQERLKRDADAYSRIRFAEAPFTTGRWGQ